MFSLRIITFIILLVLGVQSTNARTLLYNSTNIEELKNTIIKSLQYHDPKNSLVILPLDNFIIIPDHPGFHFRKEESILAVQKVLYKVKPSRRPYMDELILVNYPYLLPPAPGIVDFIHELQKYDVPIMVVTRNISGSIDEIRYLEAWTWARLAERGIDLSKSSIGNLQIKLTKGVKKIRGTYPTFYRGLLSCNSYNQDNQPQMVIANLLATRFRKIPGTIYVVGGNKGYVESLSKQFHSLKKDIHFEGFIYQVEEKFEYDTMNVDELKKFWGELVTKLNKVKREELEGDVEDPYGND